DHDGDPGPVAALVPRAEHPRPELSASGPGRRPEGAVVSSVGFESVAGIAIAGFGTVVGAREEPSPRSRRRGSRGRDRGPEKTLIKGRNFRSCTLAVLFSETALEEPFTAAERTSEGVGSGAREGRG